MSRPFAFVWSGVARLRSWMRAMTARRRLEAEMEAELTNHIEARTADLIRAGHTPDEAARRARVELGPALMHKENMRASWGCGGSMSLWAMCAMRCGCCAKVRGSRRLRWDRWRLG